MRSFQPITKVYTKQRIIEYAHQSWKIEQFKKGEIIYKEGEHLEKLYIVKNGQVSLGKLFKFTNPYNEAQVTDIKLMELQKGEVLGEDQIWFDRETLYTSKVTSTSAEILSISAV